MLTMNDHHAAAVARFHVLIASPRNNNNQSLRYGDSFDPDVRQLHVSRQIQTTRALKLLSGCVV